MKIALVTGASSGLGREFVKGIGEKYPDLDEIWAVARRSGRLEELAAGDSSRRIRPVTADLSCETGYCLLEELLEKEQPEIRAVINNAGFERDGRFHEMDREHILNTIHVNVQGCSMVPWLCLPYMKSGSFLITTGSVASFVPGAGQAVYSASKAYTGFLARALHEELRPLKINSLLICPGNMDTEMNPQVRDASEKGKSNYLPYLNVPKLVRRALEKAERGTAVYTPGLFYKAYHGVSKLFPQALMVKLAAQQQKS